MPWRIEFFEVERGTSPPRDFLTSLPPKAQVKIGRDLLLLIEFGPPMGMPQVRRMSGTTDLYELRTSLGSDDFRMLFFSPAHGHIVVLHGIRKKKERTPLRDIETAEKRRAAWLGRR
jgi:phage-related protein